MSEVSEIGPMQSGASAAIRHKYWSTPWTYSLVGLLRDARSHVRILLRCSRVASDNELIDQLVRLLPAHVVVDLTLAVSCSEEAKFKDVALRRFARFRPLVTTFAPAREAIIVDDRRALVLSPRPLVDDGERVKGWWITDKVAIHLLIDLVHLSRRRQYTRSSTCLPEVNGHQGTAISDRTLDDQSSECATEIIDGLDELDHKVLQQMANGLDDTRGADQAAVSLRTYRRRVSRILRFLQADSRFQAALIAREHRIV